MVTTKCKILVFWSFCLFFFLFGKDPYMEVSQTSLLQIRQKKKKKKKKKSERVNTYFIYLLHFCQNTIMNSEFMILYSKLWFWCSEIFIRILHSETLIKIHAPVHLHHKSLTVNLFYLLLPQINAVLFFSFYQKSMQA